MNPACLFWIKKPTGGLVERNSTVVKLKNNFINIHNLHFYNIL